MFDATKLLGALMQSRSAPSAHGRLDRAMQNSDAGSPLGQLLSQFGGGGQSTGFGSILGGLLGGGGRGAGGGMASGGAGGMLGGIGDLVQRAANSPGQEMSRNNPAAIGGIGALAGALLGGGRGAIGGGLMSVLGSLAYSAMQQQGQAATAGAPRAVPPEQAYASPDDVQRKALLMLRAMIQAAKADGQIDGQEMERITGKLDEAGEDHEARDFVLREMRGPVDLEALARDVHSPQEGAEIYAASLMAIEVDSPAERDYLQRLAQRLGLAAPAVAHIHETLGVKA